MPLRAALAGPSSDGPPVVERDPARLVFQYLGNIHEPAQIGLTSLTRRILYDFRSRRARVGEGRWYRPEDLTGNEALEFTTLIHLWERMMLARRDHAD